MLARGSVAATLLVGLLAAGGPAAAGGREVLLAWASVMTDAPPPAASRVPERELLRETAAVLHERSALFRQMAAVIAATPHLRMSIMAVTSAAPMLGNTAFRVHGAWTYGVMTINVLHRDPRLRARALAHEVAHAAEVACMPPAPTTQALLESLDPWRSAAPMTERAGETPFARAAEEVAMGEFHRRRGPGGGLPELAARFGRTLCVTVPEGGAE